MKGFLTLCLWLGLSLAFVDSAVAQFRTAPLADPATGETYHVELSGNLWNPATDIILSSEALGILGSEIDFVDDLGIEPERLRELRLVLRPARKHKFRLHYLPMRYNAESVLERSIVFNGINFRIGLPIATGLELTTWRLGYEYDFLYRDRWFAGVIVETKYTTVDVSLTSLFDTEFARATAPIPAIGGIVRGYVARNISITGELTAFKIPDSLDENYQAQYLDFDLYGTLNFTDNVGVQFGYRALDVFYVVEDDTGDIRFTGGYFGGVARF